MLLLTLTSHLFPRLPLAPPTQRVHLGRFDPENTGWLTEAQLEDFLEHWAATVSALEDMPQGFMPLYKRIAARKLLFFHGHNGRVGGGLGKE